LKTGLARNTKDAMQTGVGWQESVERRLEIMKRLP
jgi:hypothetical protein